MSNDETSSPGGQVGLVLLASFFAAVPIDTQKSPGEENRVGKQSFPSKFRPKRSLGRRYTGKRANPETSSFVISHSFVIRHWSLVIPPKVAVTPYVAG